MTIDCKSDRGLIERDIDIYYCWNILVLVLILYKVSCAVELVHLPQAVCPGITVLHPYASKLSSNVSNPLRDASSDTTRSFSRDDIDINVDVGLDSDTSD